MTVKTAFIEADGITDGENATALDYGDTLLKGGKVTQAEYDMKQAEAKRIMEERK